MKAPKQPDFVERRNTAAGAKKQLLEKMQLALKPDDPEMIALRAEKANLAAARVERRRLKSEAAVQQKGADEARELAEATTAKQELAAAAERSAAKQVEQKAERDRRYSARKNR